MLLLAGDAPPAHHTFAQLPELLVEGDLLVRNDTRVIPARLRGKRPGGGKIELLLVHRKECPDKIERWLCLARPARPLKPGTSLTFGEGALQAVVEEALGAGKVVVTFPDLDRDALMDLLATCGEVPLPPYIERPDRGPDAEDQQRYQTRYARVDGAVAAPTAGLHFTDEVESLLAQRGVQITHLTLHVGPGTFRPIKAENLCEHHMDEEFYQVNPEAASCITGARREGRRIIAVGTTTTRVLETVTDDTGVTHAGKGWTDLFIRPGHAFRGIDGLLTNFHLPRSSLLVLVSAFAGTRRVLDAYREAVSEGYRFYSYGDAMLLLPTPCA